MNNTIILLSVLDGGSFERCSLRFPTSGNRPEVTYDCLSTDDVIYTRDTDLRDLNLEWKAMWEPPSDIPDSPSYMQSAVMGLVNAHVLLIVKNEGLYTL